ncbi:Cell division inhibitor [Acidisarcina polymorpha]|uniref:Cell division inhibitor n=1 Tax=Acidisarcina polymorpha TaxID=2211140 RepID=A0A2Z5FWG3_9BACT|nr:SRPBCC family protein [Acidisarcina polymorpha]AXC10857.1 Cell division inhibitor [Acidisarcina polymorpha]
MRHTFKTEQWVPYPIQRVFLFFADPDNLPKLMPAWQKARIEEARLIAPSPPSSGDPQPAAVRVAGAGSKMNISFRPLPLFPVRTTWEASIVEFEWNHHFCDEQPKGPFAYWRHCHRVFDEKRAEVEGTKVVDDLVYELPLGMLAEPAHFLFVRRQIKGIFAYRQKKLLELLKQ